MAEIDNAKIRVLVLSAQKEIAALTIRALKNLGYTTIKFMDNGLDALKLMGTTPYDFILCDINIKFINGWLFIKEIKNAENVPNMPVILFGKEVAPDTDGNLKKYGIVKYMQMPFSESQMNFAIHSTMTLFNTSGTIENKFTKAKSSLMEKKVDQAIELYAELSGLTQGSTRSNIGLAQSFVKAEKKEEAEKILAKVAESEEDSPTRHLMTAKMSLQKKEVPNANQSIGKLLKDLPNEFYYSRAVRLYLEFNEYTSAEGICLEALGKKFEVAEFYSCLAKCKCAGSVYDQALEFIDKAEVKFGMDTDLYNLRGVCFKKLGKLDKALASYEEALRLSPNDAKVYFNLAQCAIGMKNYPDATKYLEACLKIAPGFPHVQNQLNDIRAKKVA